MDYFVRIIIALLAVQVGLACDESAPSSEPDAAASQKPAPEPSQSRETETLRVQVDYIPRFLNPLIKHDRWCHRITMGTVFETLVRANVNGGFRPHLASKVEIFDHGRLFRFTLRPNIQFHDGRPMTSADVKYTLEKMAARKSPSKLIRLELADLKRIRTPSKKTVDVILHKTNHLLLSVLAEIPIMPAHFYSRRSLRSAKLNRLPVGSGPFAVETRDGKGTLVLRRYDSYWGLKPKLKYLVFRAIPKPAKALSLLRNNELEILSNLYLGYYPKEIARDDVKRRFKLMRLHPYRMRLMIFNTRRGPLKDRRVRLALVRLADRQRMVRSIRKGMGRVLSAPMWPLSLWYNRTIHPLSLNRKAAAKLLDTAGWKTRRGKKRYRLGWPMKLTILRARESTEMAEAAQILKTEMIAAGLEVDVQVGDFGFVQTRLKRGNFDVALLGLAPRQQSDLSPWLHTKGAYNFGAYSNPRVDALLNSLKLARRSEMRLPLARRLHRQLHDDPPFSVLYAPIELMMVNRRVKGLANNGRWPKLVGLSLKPEKQ